ncbi:MAG: ABC transporter permease [candidate division NC10 bacterium]|nr:ABC transporter permease [candidate division NC10 bacterium]
MTLSLSLEKRLEPTPWVPLLPALSVALALPAGGVVLAIAGTNPWEAYKEMALGAFGSLYGLSETVVKAIPLLLAGLGVALAFRMLFWNIGAEGQLHLGALGATWVALNAPDLPAPLLQPLMILAAFFAGAAWGLIPATLKVYAGLNEIITTLMMNYIAILWMDFLVYGPWKDPHGFGFPFTAPFPPAARLLKLPGSRIHLGLALGLAAAGLLAVLLWRTRVGYEIRIIGLNPRAARYAGMNIPKVTLLVLALSGGLAGLAGLSEVAGIQGRLKHGLSPGYGYTAIIVAWLARLNPWAVVGVSVLLGGLLVGGDMLQIAMGLPVTMTYILQGLILFFVLGMEVLSGYRLILRRRGSSRAKT